MQRLHDVIDQYVQNHKGNYPRDVKVLIDAGSLPPDLLQLAQAGRISYTPPPENPDLGYNWELGIDQNVSHIVVIRLPPLATSAPWATGLPLRQNLKCPPFGPHFFQFACRVLDPPSRLQ